MSRYPMPALWIDAQFPDRVRITPVTVEKVWRVVRTDEDGLVREEQHLAKINTHANKFPVTHTRPLCELATTPEKALEKLPALLAALASRAPVTAPAVTTDAGAANPQPQPEPATT